MSREAGDNLNFYDTFIDLKSVDKIDILVSQWIENTTVYIIVVVFNLLEKIPSSITVPSLYYSTYNFLEDVSNAHFQL